MFTWSIVEKCSVSMDRCLIIKVLRSRGRKYSLLYTSGLCKSWMSASETKSAVNALWSLCSVGFRFVNWFHRN